MRKWGKSLLILGDEGGVLYFWLVFYGGETLLIVVCKFFNFFDGIGFRGDDGDGLVLVKFDNGNGVLI